MTTLHSRESAPFQLEERPSAASPRRTPSQQLEVFLALGLTVVLGLRYSLSPDVPVGFLLAVPVLPVTLGMVRRYRGIGRIALLAVACALSGLLLTWLAADHGFSDHSRTIVQTARVLGLAVGTLVLLWARSVAGTRLVVLFYAIGGFGSLVAVGVDYDNVWKFSLSVPVTMLVLSLPGVFAKPLVEMTALIGLAGVSALNDSRSAAAMMFIAAALVMTQGSKAQSKRTHSFVVLSRLAMIGLGGFFFIQSLVLDGTLGENAKERTVRQIELSGSVLLGGRPEIGASFALLTHHPFGYGAGALASPTDLIVAKTGMAALGYDPNNGYVEKYMLGVGFEVHSLLGDLWILFGVAGMLLGLALLAYMVLGLAQALSERVATGILLFLTIRLVWDFGFSPFPSAMETLMLALAIALPERKSAPPPEEVPLTSNRAAVEGPRPAVPRPSP